MLNATIMMRYSALYGARVTSTLLYRTISTVEKRGVAGGIGLPAPRAEATGVTSVLECVGCDDFFRPPSHVFSVKFQPSHVVDASNHDVVLCIT